MRIPMISLMAAGALALGGCTDMYGYDGLGVGLGYGSGYGGYGGYYGGGYSNYGYGYNSPYGGYYGSSYGYPGYSSPYYGWYDNYYYPGTGYYVYDSARNPYPMSTTQRTYWSQRSPALRTNNTTTTRAPRVQPNWSAFRAQNQANRDARQAARDARRAANQK